MKKILTFLLCIIIVCAIPLVAFAEEGISTSADTDTTVTENLTTETGIVTESEILTTEAVTETETETVIVEVDSTHFSEIILTVAGELGISFEEAQELVANAIMLGDKYFAESDFWGMVVADVQENPARWTLLAAAFLVILFLIGILVKRVLNDAMTNQKMKMVLEGISKALFGDDENDGTSIKAMISEKNAQIESLKTENAEQQKQIASLEEKAIELAEAIKVLSEAVGKVESNSDTSLKLNEETSLQILQLLYIAMDRKLPVTSAEARQIWYEHTQNRIKAIYEEGLGNGKNTDGQEV